MHKLSNSPLAVLVITSILTFSSVASAQTSPKYDPATETKLKGTIAELKLPEKGHNKEIAHLLLKTGTDTIDVYLCPRSFIDDMGVSFDKGDAIAVTGSKVKQGDSDMVLTREIVKGADTLVLRDAKGDPVWNWRK